jgi:hypothetical protein
MIVLLTPLHSFLVSRRVLQVQCPFFIALFCSSNAHGVPRSDLQVSVNVPLKSSATKIDASHAPASCSWNNLHLDLPAARARS